MNFAEIDVSTNFSDNRNLSFLHLFYITSYIVSSTASISDFLTAVSAPECLKCILDLKIKSQMNHQFH